MANLPFSFVKFAISPLAPPPNAMIWLGFIDSQPSQSQSLDSVICQYSVGYCLSVGTVGYNLCRHQEQIISAKPAPYFGVYNFQIVRKVGARLGQGWGKVGARSG